MHIDTAREWLGFRSTIREVADVWNSIPVDCPEKDVVRDALTAMGNIGPDAILIRLDDEGNGEYAPESYRNAVQWKVVNGWVWDVYIPAAYPDSNFTAYPDSNFDELLTSMLNETHAWEVLLHTRTLFCEIRVAGADGVRGTFRAVPGTVGSAQAYMRRKRRAWKLERGD